MRWGTYRSAMWFTIGIKENDYFRLQNQTSKPLKLQNTTKKRGFLPVFLHFLS